ncbi:MAG: translocation/assembly module TamB domain-containing protein, partial [Gammaproteobacteria bacterium]|nr:translocation/assembly module TamB domain-containing protein [Gammaproteobacteria bacterium]
ANLAELYPGASGEFYARGRLSGLQSAPKINARLNGKMLSIADYKINNIDSQLAVDIFNWQDIDLKLSAQSLKFKNYTLQTLDIDADSQQLKLKAVSDSVTAKVELEGNTRPQGWHGQINKIDIQTTQYANWQLDKPVAFNFDQQALLIDNLCLKSHDAKLCTKVQRNNELWQSELEIQNLPVKIFGPLLADNLKFEGMTNATANLQFSPADQLTGQAHIQLTPGVIHYPVLEGEQERWEYHSGKINITLNNQGLNASSEIKLSNDDYLQGQLTLPGAKLTQLDINKQAIQAEVQLKIHDPGLIEVMLPEIQDLKGEVELVLSINGVMAQPGLSGHAELLNGELRIPRLGLSIKKISLTGQSDDFEKLNFHLTGQSGDGQLNITGQTLLDRNAGWPTTINIKGEAFEVSNIAEARLVATPDLKIEIQQRTINISGDVLIPYANLQPKDITTAEHVSADSVVIGSEQSAEEKWSVFTKIRLTLGERVSFYGFGYDGHFGGSLLLQDEPGQTTRATGEITAIEGRYAAYGQRLAVEHGRLLYTGGSLINPGLDLRAVRRVSNITAGLKVRGTLDQPQIELFSIPAMGQTDALAYLLLGRPLESATGDDGAMMAKAVLALSLSGSDRLARSLGSRFGMDEMRVESGENGDQAYLVMGRYLSPKLYISYGVGLIESINTLNVRYQISDKWQLKGESGEHQGADILYTFER